MVHLKIRFDDKNTIDILFVSFYFNDNVCFVICFQFSIVECAMSSILDELRTYINTTPRTICVRALIITISFLLGLPMLCNVSIVFYNFAGLNRCDCSYFAVLCSLVLINCIHSTQSTSFRFALISETSIF